MAATDFITTLINRYWTLLEAHAPIVTEGSAGYIAPRNRIKLTGTLKDPFKNGWNDGDFPELTIGVPAFSDSLFTREQHYNHRPAYNPTTEPWTEDVQLDVSIEIIHPDMQYAAASARTLEVLTAIRKGGPALGITAFRVQQTGPIIGRNAVVSGRAGEYANAGGTRRLSTIITNPVLLRFKGSQLIT